MHPNNPFKNGYDLDKLVAAEPQLKSYFKKTKTGKLSLDFAQPAAVKLLNKALLKTEYDVALWDIPKGALCPPIPGRLDYLLHMGDLLAETSAGKIPKGKKTSLLDIGVGANCIYPILGQRAFGWRCVGSDSDGNSLKAAQAIISSNPGLKKNIELRHQRNAESIFTGIVAPGEHFDLCVCNPPFYNSGEEAQTQTLKKWQKMGRRNEVKRAVRNFGGNDNELHTRGGEKAFVTTMIQESLRYPKLCRWFSSQVAKQKNETPLVQALKRAQVKRVEVIATGQGNKKGRIIAWQV